MNMLMLRLLTASLLVCVLRHFTVAKTQDNTGGDTSTAGDDVPAYEHEQRLTDAIVGKTKFRKLSRPVQNVNDAVFVNFSIGLVQIVELCEKNEVLVTRLWITMEWEDKDVAWEPLKRGNLTSIRLHTDLIWTPDIALYNNAESIFHIPLVNPATVHWSGTITWAGPVVFRSSCFIDVTYFPFDRQNCSLKLGPWTHSTDQLDMVMKRGAAPVDMSRYWKSAEWHVESAFGHRSSRRYRSTAEDFYSDITYYVILRRLPLYYVVNVIVPCFEITAITLMVFSLPVGSFEKITLCVSILVSLTVFLILIIDVVPSTSHVVPLLGQFLLSTTVLVTLSIVVSVATVNIFHKPKPRKPPASVRFLFIRVIPRLLRMKSPLSRDLDDCRLCDVIETQRFFEQRRKSGVRCIGAGTPCFGNVLRKIADRFRSDGDIVNIPSKYYSPHIGRTSAGSAGKVEKAIENLLYICERVQRHQAEEGWRKEWRFVSAVIDRIFTLVYILLNIAIALQLILFRCEN